MATWTEAALLRSWRALDDKVADGWRLVPLHVHPTVTLLAGRSHPGNRHAIVAIFPRDAISQDRKLPVGEGFDILEPNLPEFEDQGHAISLVRRPNGAEDMFATFAVDVLRNIDLCAEQPARAIFSTFIERVREWQDFMSSNRPKPLSSDQQVGLMGEVVMLERIADRLGRFDVAASSWVGPLRAAQDFHVNGVAIEVKSTVTQTGFPAKINSIEQLDSDLAPLFLCALRFSVSDEGESLAALVDRLRQRADAAGIPRQFEALLFSVRYFDEHAPFYVRPLLLQQHRCWEMINAFPRLTRSGLPTAIVSANYKMNIDAVDLPSISIDEMVEEMNRMQDATR